MCLREAKAFQLHGTQASALCGLTGAVLVVSGCEPRAAVGPSRLCPPVPAERGFAAQRNAGERSCPRWVCVRMSDAGRRWRSSPGWG